MISVKPHRPLILVFKGTNQGSKPQDVGKESQKISSPQTTGWTFSSSTSISVKTNIKTGIPVIAAAKIESGITETLAYGESGPKSSSIAVSVDTGGNSVAAYSRQMFVFKSTMKAVNVPFTATATMKNQCGNNTKKITISIQARVSGVASFAQGEVSKVIGPAVPMECDSPFDTPIDKQNIVNFCPDSGAPECKSNALCVRYQITGNKGICCDPSDPSSCCAVAKAHKKCDFKAEEILWPSKQGKFHPCCEGVAFKMESNSTTIDSQAPNILMEVLIPY